MLGAGLYVLTGTVTKDTSGPAIVFSYMAAAVAAFMSALCYAEFGSRIPTSGIVFISLINVLSADFFLASCLCLFSFDFNYVAKYATMLIAEA